MNNFLPYLNPMLSSLPRFVGLFVFMFVALHFVGITMKKLSRKNVLNKNTLALLKNILVILVFAVSGLSLLDALGLPLAPLLTAVGVSGLALALGLQATLSNLFAGIQLLLGRTIRLGDTIKLQSGETGKVTDISWRHTQIRTEQQNTTVIPNAHLANTIVTNFTHPVAEITFEVPFEVSVENDLDKVRTITQKVWVEIANEQSEQSVPNQLQFLCLRMIDGRLSCASCFVTESLAEKKDLTSRFLTALHQQFKEMDIRF